MRKHYVIILLTLISCTTQKEYGEGNNLKSYISIKMYSVEKSEFNKKIEDINIANSTVVLDNDDYDYIKIMQDVLVQIDDPDRCFAFVCKLKKSNKLMNLTLKNRYYILALNNSEFQKVEYSSMTTAGSIEFGFFTAEEIQKYLKGDDWGAVKKNLLEPKKLEEIKLSEHENRPVLIRRHAK